VRELDEVWCFYYQRWQPSDFELMHGETTRDNLKPQSQGQLDINVLKMAQSNG
jgi:hypothetical protein